MSQRAWIRQERVHEFLRLSEEWRGGDLLSPLVEQMIDENRLREGSLKQMDLSARTKNKDLASMLAHREAQLCGESRKFESRDDGFQKMAVGGDFWPPTARKLQWTRVLIHGKVMQLKVTLGINSQPDRDRMVRERRKQVGGFLLSGESESEVLRVL